MWQLQFYLNEPDGDKKGNILEVKINENEPYFDKLEEGNAQLAIIGRLPNSLELSQTTLIGEGIQLHLLVLEHLREFQGRAEPMVVAGSVEIRLLAIQ